MSALLAGGPLIRSCFLVRSPVDQFKMRNLENHFPRTQTIEFALRDPPERNRGPSDASRLERIDSRPGLSYRSKSHSMSISR